jgi:hypothetical protein
MSAKQELEEKNINEKLTAVGKLIRTALDAAAHGKDLTPEDRLALFHWLRGDDWSKRLTAEHSEMSKMMRTQIMMLGPDLHKALRKAIRDGQLAKEDRIELDLWLDTTRQTQRRHLRRRRIYYLVYAFGILLASLLVRPLIPYTGLDANPLVVPFIVSVVILLVSIIKDINIDKNVDTALDDMRSMLEKTKEDLQALIKTNLRPRIIALDSREKVLRAASEILFDAIQEQPDKRFVVFIGAASLSTQTALQTPDKDEETISPAEEYNTRLLNLDGAKVPVKRYIALIKPKDFNSRRPETRKQYLQWLRKQIGLLKDNSKYVLVDCGRAQPWGGSRSSIITSGAFLDIVGEGDSGFLIKGEEIATTLKESSEKLFSMANQFVYKGGSEESIERLNAMHGELKARL